MLLSLISIIIYIIMKGNHRSKYEQFVWPSKKYETVSRKCPVILRKKQQRKGSGHRIVDNFTNIYTYIITYIHIQIAHMHMS